MNTISLNGIWTVWPEEIECTGNVGLEYVRQVMDGWIEAQVPGEIHLDLMHARQMPNPSVSANMPNCRWPETKSWWYRITFEVHMDFLQHESQHLIFDGLDLYSQVFLNGMLVGEAANAFIPAIFDVKHFLLHGQNELIVRLTAGSELALAEAPSGQPCKTSDAVSSAIPNPMQEGDLYGHRNWAGRKWLRKPQFSYGWDWVDALPNIGIWRGVHLEGRTHIILQDLRLDTLLENDRVCLEMDAVLENLHPWSERSGIFELEIRSPDGSAVIHRHYVISIPPGRMPLRDIIEIPEAQLWWPNGMGEQPLYTITALVTNRDRIICDCLKFAIGLRTITIDRTQLVEGSRFCICVNGQEVFCRGGNIGPHDAILARISDDKYEMLVSEAKNANMNMIRINGCSIYEGSAFYDACDRAGILIWQDFMLTCTTYPDSNQTFREAIHAEAETVIRALRHHACIALWCGNNECHQGFAEWWNTDNTQPSDLGGQIIYNKILPDLCRLLDPQRPYWPGSPCGGDTANSEFSGDCHWWGPFFMNPDVRRRIRHETFDECRARFVSEYGVIGPCHLDSISEYLSPDEMRTDSLAWRMHTNTFEKETVPAAIRFHYADPESLSIPEYITYGQMFQAVIHGYALEALRFRKHDLLHDCQGALIWSYSDCWGETGWSILDYYLRRKASYYWFRRACAPVKIIVRRRADRLVTRIVNDSLQTVNVIIEYGWWQLDGRNKEIKSHPVSVSANNMLEVDAEVIPAVSERDPKNWIYASVLRRPDGLPFDQSVVTCAPYRELALATPKESLVL